VTVGCGMFWEDVRANADDEVMSGYDRRRIELGHGVPDCRFTILFLLCYLLLSCISYVFTL